MSKKKNFNQEKNPFQMVLYIIAVALLLACIVFLFFSSQRQYREFEEEVERLDTYETDLVFTERETESGNQTEEEMDLSGGGLLDNTEQPETESDAVQTDAVVLVLNGTKRPGIAGLWKAHLEEAGYTNVYTATYSLDVADDTVIHTDEQGLGDSLKTHFANAAVQAGRIEFGIEAEEEEPLPETIDAYIVVGRNDAVQ